MIGLLVNMNLWKNLLKHREFDAAVDHVAVAQIMKAKTEPVTTRIMRLLGYQYTVLTFTMLRVCLLYTSPSPRDATLSRMPSSA